MTKINWTHPPTCESPDGRYFSWDCRGGRVAVIADVGTSGRWRAIWARTGCESASDSSDPSEIAYEVKASIRYCGGIAEAEPIAELHAEVEAKRAAAAPTEAQRDFETRLAALEAVVNQRLTTGTVEPDWHEAPEIYGVWREWPRNRVRSYNADGGWMVVLWDKDGLAVRTWEGRTPTQAALTVRVLCGAP